MRIGFVIGQIIVLVVQVFGGLILTIAAGQFLHIAVTAYLAGNSPVVFGAFGIGTAALASVFVVPPLFRRVLRFGTHGVRRLVVTGLFVFAVMWMCVPLLALQETSWWESVPADQRTWLKYVIAVFGLASFHAFVYPGAAFAPYRITAEDLARDMLPRRRVFPLSPPVSLAPGERWSWWRRVLQMPALVLILSGIFGAVRAPVAWLSDPWVLETTDRWWLWVALAAAALATLAYAGLQTRSLGNRLRTNRQRLVAVFVLHAAALAFAAAPALNAGLPALAHFALKSDAADASVKVASIGAGERRTCAYQLSVVWPEASDLPAPICELPQALWSGAKAGDALVLRGDRSALGLRFSVVKADAAP